MQKAAEDAVARETVIRADAAQTAEAALQDRIAAADAAKKKAEEARQTAEAELHTQLAAAGAQLQGLKEAHAAEINSQREALEKDKIASVNAERVKSLETKMKLEEQLQDMTRQLQKRTADELGEGAELELHDVLKEAFDGDKIRASRRAPPARTSFTRSSTTGKPAERSSTTRKIGISGKTSTRRSCGRIRSRRRPTTPSCRAPSSRPAQSSSTCRTM